MAAEMIRIEKPSPPSIVAELSPLVQAALAFEVSDVETNAMALERVRDLRRGEKMIADHFEPTRKHLDAAKKELLAFRDQLIGPIAAARSVYDGKAAEYEAAERKKAEEEQRRLQAEARRQEEERVLMAAIEADAAGQPEAAEAILAGPVHVPMVTVSPSTAKVDGVSSSTRWSAEVHDLHALVSYVAKHPEWISMLEPSMPTLNRLAVSQRDAMSIPGVRAVSRTIRTSR